MTKEEIIKKWEKIMLGHAAGVRLLESTDTQWNVENERQKLRMSCEIIVDLKKLEMEK